MRMPHLRFPDDQERPGVPAAQRSLVPISRISPALRRRFPRICELYDMVAKSIGDDTNYKQLLILPFDN